MSEEKKTLKTLKTLSVGDVVYLTSQLMETYLCSATVTSCDEETFVVFDGDIPRRFSRDSGEHEHYRIGGLKAIILDADEAAEQERRKAMETRRTEVSAAVNSLRFIRIPDEALDAVVAACEAFKAAAVAAGCKL